MANSSLSVAPEALSLAASQAKAAAGEIDDAQVHAGQALSNGAFALDPASRAALEDFARAWRLLGVELSGTAESAGRLLSSSAEHYGAVETSLEAMLRRSR